MSQKYDDLKRLCNEIALQGGILAELSWNQETYMPKGAHANRANQIELLAGIRHKLKTGPEFKKILSSLIDIKTGKIKTKLSKDEETNVIRLREDFIRDHVLPVSFVEKFAKLTSEATEVWQRARQENKFKLFLPYLEKLVTLNQEKADRYGFDEHPYDALLDGYEPGVTTRDIRDNFDPLKKTLQEFVKKARSAKIKLPFKTYPQEEQFELSRRLLEKLPYDFNNGRLDISTHPFSSAQHPTDSRITTRIDLKDPLSSILTVLHEAGHALYEMGLNAKYFGLPLGEPISYGIHESQSRWWETRIGLSLAFWKGFTPLLHSMNILNGVSAEKLYQYVNHVEPSFIRVEADELTYPLHVILRFELETALIDGSLKAKDLPEKWNELMKTYLGITPKTDTLGCLQDVHWSHGSFGYFPTYLLGNMYAAQLFDAFEKEHPNWKKRVEKLDLPFIKEWLNHNIHRHGRRYQAMELIKKVTKKPFSSKPYIDYLENKYITGKK